MTAGTGEQVAVLLLTTAWSALGNQEAPNNLALANSLLEELDAEAARDAVGLLVRAFVITAEHALDLDIDCLLKALGMSVAVAEVGS